MLNHQMDIKGAVRRAVCLPGSQLEYHDPSYLHTSRFVSSDSHLSQAAHHTGNQSHQDASRLLWLAAPSSSPQGITAFKLLCPVSSLRQSLTNTVLPSSPIILPPHLACYRQHSSLPNALLFAEDALQMLLLGAASLLPIQHLRQPTAAHLLTQGLVPAAGSYQEGSAAGRKKHAFSSTAKELVCSTWLPNKGCQSSQVKPML